MMLDQLFTMEMLPSTLAVVALIIYVLGQYRSSICGEDENNMCNQFLKNADMMAIVSSGMAALLIVCICMGFISLSGSSGMMGGGYGGYGGMF